MELEIMLSEVSQSHKDKYCMFSFMCGSEGKTKEKKKYKVMIVKEGLQGKCEGKEWEKEVGEKKEQQREYNQTMLYACMEIS
jgi:hypothetical protein